MFLTPWTLELDTMSRCACLLTCVLSLPALLLADPPAQPTLSLEIPRPVSNRIVPGGVQLQLLYTRTAPIKGGLTEGPTVAPDGSIYFSDIPLGTDKGLIVRYIPATGKTEIFADDSHKSNGLKFNPAGDLIACEGADYGGRCIAKWDVKTRKRTVLVESYNGKRFNSCNDLVIDPQGRIYFSDPRYLGHEPREQPHRAVYRLDPAGTVVEVTHDVEKPNGLALSPDMKTLYLADHNNGTDRIEPTGPRPTPGAMKIYAFPLGADGLVAGPRRTIYDFKNQAGCDGMTVDTQGNVYLAARSLNRPGVLVLNPDGVEQAFIPSGQPIADPSKPVGLPSNVTFGLGADSHTLYVTVDLSLYKIRLRTEGYHIPFQVTGGK